MKRRTFAHLILMCPVFLTVLRADSVILKKGGEIQGQIISNDSNGIVIEYFATPTIRDQKTFTQEEVVRVVKSSEDEKAFQDLGKLTPPPTALDQALLDDLGRKIDAFLGQYPTSPHYEELKAANRLLEEDRARLRMGDRKIDGVWTLSRQIAADPYQWAAKLKFQEVKEYSRNNDPVKALRSYELLEKNYPGSRVLPDALDLALQQLEKLQELVITAKSNFEVIDKRRQKALAISTSDQAKEIREGLRSEEVSAKAIAKEVELDGTKFVYVFPNTLDALNALQKVITTEKVRVGLLQKIPMRQSLHATGEAIRLLSSGNLKEATAELPSAEKFWPANVEIASVKHQIEMISKEQTNTPAPSPAAQATSTTIKP
jgi:hypothetical protein